MDSSNLPALARALLPKVPLMLNTTFHHALSLSPTSKDWDLRTALTIHVLRSFCATDHPAPVSKAQKLSLRDPGIKGPMWVSKHTYPRPIEGSDTNAQAQLEHTFNLLKRDSPGAESATLPSDLATAPVEIEWTGYRSGVGANEPEPPISEGEKYAKLMEEVKSDVTILYFHGGAYYLLDPCSHRLTTSRLARLTKGRVCSVRYRLAPQHPFPCALLDALTAYLSLLYPPPGSPHAPVPASQIVFSGDSAGAGLCMALLQLILTLQRDSSSSSSPSHSPPTSTILWHNESVPLPPPCAIATNSAWLDLTHALPSVATNARYDYLPPPRLTPIPFAPCAAWPTSPPRHDVYTTTENLLHPLVSPVLSPSWEGSPPLYMQVGEEMLMDETLCVAGWAARGREQEAGEGEVRVVLDLFERMPHCFALVMPEGEGARRAFEAWAAFCTDVVLDANDGTHTTDGVSGKDGTKGGEKRVQTRGRRISVKTFSEKEVDVRAMEVLGREEVRSRMRDVLRRREEAVEEQGKSGKRAKAKL